ncbi:MAG: hypothetical protein DWI03_08180 [Planctomycetota bacterium]|nr:MAG: hypothetical protein DWI03_08180 [Planctomycetota bacterium]
MATNRTTVATLTIALIVFVILTFVLAVTTYLFFQRWMEEYEAGVALKAADVTKNEQLGGVQQDNAKLREVIGAGEEELLDAIETSKNELFTQEFAGFSGDQKTYRTLVAWLADELKARDQKVKDAEAKFQQAMKLAEDKVKEADAAKQVAVASLQDAKDTFETEVTKFNTDRSEHETKQSKLVEEKSKAEAGAERYRLVVQEIAKFGGVLSAASKPLFDSAVREGNPTQQLEVVYRELQSREKVIKTQNETLSSLRVASTGQQQAVLAATPRDERIDGFDGRVSTINEADHTAMVSFRSTAGMRPGLVLAVYDPSDPKPRVGSRKGLLEVIGVEGPTMARARIREDSTRNPILSGDGVASSLWSVGTAPEVAIVGFVRLDGDTRPDRDRLVALVERSGGQVVDSVTESTAMVVDAGVPPPSAGDTTSTWRKEDGERRNRALEKAKQAGVRVTGIDALLDMLGQNREAFETRGGARAPETRRPPAP